MTLNPKKWKKDTWALLLAAVGITFYIQATGNRAWYVYGLGFVAGEVIVTGIRWLSRRQTASKEVKEENQGREVLENKG